MRETKIIQVYPSDSAIASAIDEWQSFGWEMTDNQRFSDKSSVTIPFVGKETTTTTYNKLTFSREKSNAWYPEVKRLEDEYETIKNQKSAILRNKPEKKKLGCLDVITIYLPIPLISFIIYQIVKKAKYKKALAKFESSSNAKLDELTAKADSIRKAAQNIVDGL